MNLVVAVWKYSSKTVVGQLLPGRSRSLEIVSIPRFLTKYSLGGTLNLKTPMFVFIETLFIIQLLCKSLRVANLYEFGTGRSEIQYKIGCRLTGSREALELAQDGDGGFSTPRSQNSAENYDKTPQMSPESVSASGFGGEAHACTKIFPKSQNKLIFLGTYRCSSDRWSSTSKLRISLVSPDF